MMSVLTLCYASRRRVVGVDNAAAVVLLWMCACHKLEELVPASSHSRSRPMRHYRRPKV